MSGYNREYVGTVRMISGRLVVGDVDVLRARGDRLDSESMKVFQDEPGHAPICDDKAVALATPYLSGNCQVFVSYDDRGRPTSVEIELEE